MFNRKIFLAASVCLAASMAALGQPGTDYVFQLPGQNNSGSTILGYGYNANPFNSSINALGPAGAFKIVASVDGSKYYVLGATLQIANSSFSSFTTLNNFATPPTDAVTTPDGKYVLIAAGDFFVLDATTNQIVLQSSGLGSIISMVVSRDSQTAYVLSDLPSGGVLNAFDLAGKTKTGVPLQLTGGPTSLTISPLGLLYATAYNRIFEIDPKTLTVTPNGTISPNLTSPGPLRFTPDGTTAYFVNLNAGSSGSSLYQLNLSNYALTNWPQGFVTAPLFSEIYVASNTRIFAFSATTQTLYDITPSPFGAAVSSLNAVLAPGTTTNNPPTLQGIALSSELPSALYLYADVLNSGAVNLLRVKLATNQIDAQANNAAGTVLEFAGAPPQTGPGGFLQFNNIQTVAAGATSLPLVARVLDGTGRPIFNYPVSFTTDPTTGLTINTPTAVSNADGYVQTTIVAPANGGAYTVTITAGTATANFTINVPGGGGGGGVGGGNPNSNQITIVSGDGQLFDYTTSGGSAFPLTVLVTDPNGNPLPNQTVTFSVTSGQGGVTTCLGCIDVNTSVTDQNGLASAYFATPNLAGQGNFTFENDIVNASIGCCSVNFSETTLLYPDPEIVLLTPTRDSGLAITVPRGGVLQNGVTAQILASAAPQIGVPIPGIGIYLVDPNTLLQSPYASCQGSSNSDQDGIAHCNVVASCKQGLGTFPIGYSIGNYRAQLGGTITITQGAAQALAIASGNNQTVNAGQTSLPLVATITDGCGNPVSGQTVTWTVTAGLTSGSIKTQTTKSDPNGNVNATIQMTQTPGTVQVKLVLGTAATVTFTLTNQAVASTLTITGGNNQSALINKAFASPLTVQVLDSKNNPVPGATVTFTVNSGSVTVNPASATTDSSGHASTSATAGGTIGSAQVIASLGSLTQTFQLSVIPNGPQVSSASFLNAASFANGLAPCGLATVVGTGLAPGVQGTIYGGQLFGPLPYSLSNLSLTVNGIPAPIYSMTNQGGKEQVTFQTPCEVSATNSGTVVVTLSGASTTVTGVPIYTSQPGIFVAYTANGKSYGSVVGTDGQYVTASHPAVRGQTYYLIATGLGQLTPPASTNSLGVNGQQVALPVTVGLNNGGVPVVSTQYQQGSIGVYVIGFTIPLSNAAGIDQPLALAVTLNGNLVFGNPVYLAAVQ